MGKSAPSPPAAPSPSAIAGAQTGSNLTTAIGQTDLNAVNQNTPYGSSTFTQTGTSNVTDPSNGQTYTLPQYTQNVTLNPNEQATLTNHQQLAKTLSGYGGQVAANNAGAITNPLNFSNLPAMPTSINMNDPAVKAAETGAYNSQADLVTPYLNQQREMTENAAQNAGIPQSSQAYQNMEQQLSTNEAATLDPLAAQAQNAGLAEAQNQAALQAAARQQGISEQVTQQNQPINELSALLQGAPAIGSPGAMAPPQTGVSPTDVTGAYGIAQNAAEANYNAQLNQASAGNGAFAGLLGSGMMAGATMY